MTNTRVQKMLATKAATAARRATQDLRVRELKIVESSLHSAQRETLERFFLEAKWLRNSIIAVGISEFELGKHGVHVQLPNGTLEARTIQKLPAHVKQTLHKGLIANTKALATSKAKGRQIGAIRFVNRVDSLEFPTGDVRIQGRKAHIPRLGWVRVRGYEHLGEELANARLVRRASGYYLLIASLTVKQEQQNPEGEPVGLDFGIKTHITVSDGREWNLTVEEPERLKRLQRKLQRQTKGSNNRAKTLAKIQRSYERLDNLKNEAANQFVATLKGHEFVAFQNENLRGWKARKGYGKVVHHSAMGRVKAKLRRLPQGVMVDRFAPTTQLCPACGSLNRLPLSERVYSCECGYRRPRDLHAAENMLRFVEIHNLSPGESGAAPVEKRAPAAPAVKPAEEVSRTSMKQETIPKSLTSEYCQT